MINEYFLEVFESVPRQGPGSNEETRKAYSFLTDLPKNPTILDIGCGKGIQSIELAKISNGHVVAMDMHKPFLSGLQLHVVKENLQDKITCLVGDMGAIPFLDKQFNTIWAEGSAFIIGYKRALTEWKKYIKPGGFLVFSDCVWLKNDRPKELVDFWKSEAVDLPTVPDVLKQAKQSDYTFINHFTLSNNSWKAGFYDYIEKVLTKVKDKYKGNVEAQDTFFAIEQEIEMFNKYHEYFGYEFFALKC
jgi:ubiquinone/menaquinone biosynthesis C-methylase UbiE